MYDSLSRLQKRLQDFAEVHKDPREARLVDIEPDFDNRVFLLKKKIWERVAKAEAEAIVMQKKATGEIDWDLEMAKGSQSSWKDEWLTILFSIPLILAFIPGMEEVVANGFAQLNAMPEWYQYSLGVIVAASFGVRSATKFFGKK